MRSRELPSSKHVSLTKVITVAAIALIVLLMAAAFLFSGEIGYLVLSNPKTGDVYHRYLVRRGDTFSVGFIHSVNQSPLTDYYEIRDEGIYVVKTVYYDFGAGVQTQIEEGQTLTYGDDGSMIVTGFNTLIPDLIYFVGTVSDHTLTLHHKQISLRDLCGRNAMVRFHVSSLFEPSPKGQKGNE